MPNTKSSAKALRQSNKKRAHNLYWKRQIKAVKSVLTKMLEDDNSDILKLREQQSALQKVLDKATKNKVIHKNKANRIKSRFAKRPANAKRSKSKSKPSK